MSGRLSSHNHGIVLSSLFRRALLAWELRDLNVLISSKMQDESRLLLYQAGQIQERARKVAPFLRLDSDPYVAIIDGGLKWIQPAYTASSRYPYSQPDNGINYVRDSMRKSSSTRAPGTSTSTSSTTRTRSRRR